MATVTNRSDRTLTYFLAGDWNRPIRFEPMVLTQVDGEQWEDLQRVPNFADHCDRRLLIVSAPVDVQDTVDTSQATAQKGADYLNTSKKKGFKPKTDGVEVAPSPDNTAAEIRGTLTVEVE